MRVKILIFHKVEWMTCTQKTICVNIENFVFDKATAL